MSAYRSPQYDEAEQIAKARADHGGHLVRTCPLCGREVQEFGKGLQGKNFLRRVGKHKREARKAKAA